MELSPVAQALASVEAFRGYVEHGRQWVSRWLDGLGYGDIPRRWAWTAESDRNLPQDKTMAHSQCSSNLCSQVPSRSVTSATSASVSSADECPRPALDYANSPVPESYDHGNAQGELLAGQEGTVLRTGLNTRNEDYACVLCPTDLKALEALVTGSEEVSCSVPQDDLVDTKEDGPVCIFPYVTDGRFLREFTRQNGRPDRSDNANAISARHHLRHAAPQSDCMAVCCSSSGLDFKIQDLLPSICGQIRPALAFAASQEPFLLVDGSHIAPTTSRGSGDVQDAERHKSSIHAPKGLSHVVSNEISHLNLMPYVSKTLGQGTQSDDKTMCYTSLKGPMGGEGQTVYRISQENGRFFTDGSFTHAIGGKPSSDTKPGVSHAVKAYLEDAAIPSGCAHQLNWTSSYFALQSSTRSLDVLRVYITSTAPEGHLLIKKALEKVEQPLNGAPALVRVHEAAQSDLVIRIGDTSFQYTLREPLVGLYGDSRQLQYSTKPSVRSIHRVLNSAAHFFRLFHNRPKQPRLHVEFHALVQDEDAELGPDLRRPWAISGPNLYNSGLVDLVADDDTPYGIAVHNTSDRPLHVWAFYFNCSTLSITEYYRPPRFERGAEPCLPPRGVLTIGYGPQGGLPYTFFLHEGQDMDVGCIKLFITTEAVDLSGFAQRSPFIRPESRSTRPAMELNDAAWDSTTITVVQRKLEVDDSVAGRASENM
ncbi:unnamed protein product [Peniophora sp. CBMAI 1063]|nr:unnamed protein product [Peniophora sp. CBMAI 1063]